MPYASKGECLREAERLLREADNLSPEYRYAHIYHAQVWIELSKARS